MTSNDTTDLLTVAEALRLLKVSRGTLHRWRQEGRLRAYHAGPKAVRFRRGDLEAILTRAPRKAVRDGTDAQPAPLETAIRPLTDDALRRGRDALAASQARIARLRARRGGVPFAPSWPLIREVREECEQHL